MPTLPEREHHTFDDGGNSVCDRCGWCQPALHPPATLHPALLHPHFDLLTAAPTSNPSQSKNTWFDGCKIGTSTPSWSTCALPSAFSSNRPIREQELQGHLLIREGEQLPLQRVVHRPTNLYLWTQSTMLYPLIHVGGSVHATPIERRSA